MLTCRVTGPQSIERLVPLLKTLGAKYDLTITDDGKGFDFVWETACEINMKAKHDSSVVLNRLHNSNIFEDKANLAFLQRKTEQFLKTYVANSALEVSQWCASQFNGDEKVGEIDTWWAIKACKGNGGKDVWVLNRENWLDVVSELPKNQDYVIQSYIQNPMLWRGKKFHFRCYSVIRGDLSAYVYQDAFILSASRDYDDSCMDTTIHLTNLSVNKRSPGHPGQIPCNLLRDYPNVSVAFEVRHLYIIILCLSSGVFPNIIALEQPCHGCRAISCKSTKCSSFRFFWY